MVGGDGNDLTSLYGGAGDDYLIGGGASLTTLDGGEGNDILLIRKGALVTNAYGGDGDDVIILDADQSTEAGYAGLFGGEGSDTFVITGPGSQYGGQVIRDFEANDSIVIDLEGFGISSLDQLQIEWMGNTHWIKANGQKVISVQGVDEHYDVMQHISELTAQQSQDWSL
ncbi:M10 family metallopeptidase C-terminal domain-containing protein [Ruegeria sp.]|uniref:M10 family metallopeptidase C-terminal domain-containing protein n=1 Tax=Ruegeria sp. TaxID=1879320 RepID=UPI003C7CD36E